MKTVRSLAFALLVYGGVLGLAAVTPAQADAQIVYGNYGGYGYSYGYYNYPTAVYPQVVYPTYNWVGNPHWSGYPQWYVNYVRWNSPANPYTNPYYSYRPYWRRW